jgi:hypothetical protein
MELYFKNSEGQLQETNLIQILSNALKTANFKMDNGSFEGDNHKWIGVVQKSKNKTQVVTNITFLDDGNTITGLNVYETPIITLVDEENSRQVV